MNAITMQDVSYRHPHAAADVLSALDLAIPTGVITTFVGVNGSGKSTLLRLLCGVLRPDRGTIDVLGLDPARTPRRRFAQQVSVMHQSLPPVLGMRVHEFVSQGQFAAKGAFGMLRGPSSEATEEALAAVGIASLADRTLDSLSGGERQRARLAAALVQGGQLLMLDEPTAHLDAGRQLELLALVHDIAAQRNLTVVQVLHDLDQAARFSDRIVVVADAGIHRVGAPTDVLDVDLLETVFGVTGDVTVSQSTTRPHRGAGSVRVRIDAPVQPV